jgi:type VI secretion system protein ImpA
MQEGRGPVARDEFDKAQHDATYEQCKQRFDDLTACVDELNKLSADLGTYMASAAPGMTDLKAAVGECYTLAKQLVKQREPVASSEEGGGAESDGSGGGGGTGRAMASRAEAYRRLAEAADLLERLEPHSPIPYLVRRAVELGALPFPQLMKALIRDDNVLSGMNRELGIKDESSGY